MRTKKITEAVERECEQVVIARLSLPTDKELAYRNHVSVSSISKAMMRIRERIKLKALSVSRETNSEMIAPEVSDAKSVVPVSRAHDR